MATVMGNAQQCFICGSKLNPVIEDIYYKGDTNNLELIVLCCPDCAKKLGRYFQELGETEKRNRLRAG